MCGGGGGDGGAAARAEAAENARQNRISQGMKQLEALFQGGQRGTGRLVNTTEGIDSSKPLYNVKGEQIQFKPGAEYFASKPGAIYDSILTMSTDPVTGQPVSQDQSYDQAARMSQISDMLGEGIYSGTEQSGGFNDEFYAKAYNAQKNYALPQVDKQFADAQKQLAYALARQGISASSQSARLNADLQGQRALALQGVEDSANQARNTQKANVEAERGELMRLLTSTGDAESTLQTAQNQANLLSQAPKLEAVGPLFQNATGTLADLIVSPALRAQQGGGAGQSGYGLGRSSGKVVGS